MGEFLLLIYLTNVINVLCLPFATPTTLSPSKCVSVSLFFISSGITSIDISFFLSLISFVCVCGLLSCFLKYPFPCGKSFIVNPYFLAFTALYIAFLPTLVSSSFIFSLHFIFSFFPVRKAACPVTPRAVPFSIVPECFAGLKAVSLLQTHRIWKQGSIAVRHR